MASTKGGSFHWLGWVQLKGLASTKRNALNWKESLPLKEMMFTK